MTERTFSPTFQSFEPDSRKLHSLPEGSKVLVVGAGVFGSWAALFLQENGYQVTLVDTYGPGNPRSTSGGKSRLVRTIYGDNQLYFDWTLRSIELWNKYQRLWQKDIYRQIGTLWFCHEKDDPLINASIEMLETQNIPFQKFTQKQAVQLYPQLNVDDLEYLLFEEKSGYVLARESVLAVTNSFQEIGGQLMRDKVDFELWDSGINEIKLSSGKKLSYDFMIAACGPWLEKCFPDVLTQKIEVTKQDVLFFGLPEQELDFHQNTMPSWVDQSTGEFYYGIRDEHSGTFKIALDRRGKIFDPDSDDRVPDKMVIEQSRNFIAHRFPRLKNMPLITSKVCQYSNTIDGNFICDLHPNWENVLLVGGGSGHGFKHGPALGEHIWKLLSGKSPLHPLFSLANK